MKVWRFYLEHTISKVYTQKLVKIDKIVFMLKKHSNVVLRTVLERLYNAFRTSLVDVSVDVMIATQLGF